MLLSAAHAKSSTTTLHPPHTTHPPSTFTESADAVSSLASEVDGDGRLVICRGARRPATPTCRRWRGGGAQWCPSSWRGGGSGRQARLGGGGLQRAAARRRSIGCSRHGSAGLGLADLQRSRGRCMHETEEHAARTRSTHNKIAQDEGR